MVSAAAVAGFDCSLTLALTLPSDAVTVKVLATVGSVNVVLASPLEPVIAGLGEKVPPTPPSAKVMSAPTTIAPEEFLAFTTIGRGKVVPAVPTCLPPEIPVIVATTPPDVA